jgi:hypothetical protein
MRDFSLSAVMLISVEMKGDDLRVLLLYSLLERLHCSFKARAVCQEHD